MVTKSFSEGELDRATVKGEAAIQMSGGNNSAEEVGNAQQTLCGGNEREVC